MADILALFFAISTNTQPFWVWMILGLILLGIELLMGTQWLLWPAASAGLVAVVTLTSLPIGIISQIILFALLSVSTSLVSRRLFKPVDAATDINDPHARLVGQDAVVIGGFDAAEGDIRTGRVMLGGVEWPAVFEPDTSTQAPVLRTSVRVLKVKEGSLYVDLLPPSTGVNHT